MILILFVVLVVFILCKYVFNVGQSKESALSKAIRRTSYDLDYIDKQANAIALGANVIAHGSKITLEIPTRGLWQLSTNPQVAQCLMERVNSKEFKRFLDLNYSDVAFSKPRFEQNKIVIVGTKSDINHRFGSFDPRSGWNR
ncbi:hypothetical protein [Lactobacillus amylovorus]|uniref:hypothetical protein n=1 Tax=Lactobacillus amylovorus TaxID=1604 RepID=UPI00201D70D2|nr:hypothetical protein [Lactobacillus amylovorus]